jgi:hypothetical protein
MGGIYRMLPITRGEFEGSGHMRRSAEDLSPESDRIHSFPTVA